MLLRIFLPDGCLGKALSKAKEAVAKKFKLNKIKLFNFYIKELKS